MEASTSVHHPDTVAQLTAAITRAGITVELIDIRTDNSGGGIWYRRAGHDTTRYLRTDTTEPLLNTLFDTVEEIEPHYLPGLPLIHDEDPRLAALGLGLRCSIRRGCVVHWLPQIDDPTHPSRTARAHGLRGRCRGLLSALRWWSPIRALPPADRRTRKHSG